MTNLFKKALFFTDSHFGLKNNSIIHNRDCEQFVNWACKLGKEQGCDTCFFLGDYHNNRASINLLTLQFALRGLERMNESFDQTFFIPGNHDTYYRDSRAVHSMEFAKHLKNIVVVNDFFKVDGVSIVPWLIGDDHKKLQKISADYMMGHFELPNFYMNAQVLMPETNEIRADHFKNVGHVFSGHFHKRQTAGNITYIGNCFPHNFSDVNDMDRGVMILEWGKEPNFFAWPDAPSYHIFGLSEILDNAETILKKGMHIRVNLDVDISYEEANFIKDTFVNSYDLRELKLIPTKKTEHENDTTSGEIKFQTVDQILMESLKDIESNHFQNQLLMDIYRGL